MFSLLVQVLTISFGNLYVTDRYDIKPAGKLIFFTARFLRVCCLPFASVLPFHLPFPRRLRPCPSVSGNNNNKINKVKYEKKHPIVACCHPLASVLLVPTLRRSGLYALPRVLSKLYTGYIHMSHGSTAGPAPRTGPGTSPGTSPRIPGSAPG